MLDYARFDEAIGLNWFEVDPDLQALVHRYVPAPDRKWARERLLEIGALIGGPIARRAETTDRNPPRLERYDRWGADTGRVVHHPGALESKRDLFEAGRSLQRPGRDVPAAVGTAVGYLLDQAETAMTCATGMTGGVAALVDAYAPSPLREHLLGHLRPEAFEDLWDGAMFMTERGGGSDLGRATETVAAPISEDGTVWRLNGFKWFCSNVDGRAIATLARPQGGPDGVRGLALFVVPRERLDGTPNGVVVRRIKDKLGTRAVPTGEVDFVDAEGYLLAGAEASADGQADGHGLARMMTMVQASRLGVALMGLGIMRRSFLEAAVYAAHREAFGARIDSFPLVRETLVRMLMEVEAGAAICFDAATARERGDDGSYRILAPLAKYRCARRGVQLSSAAVEMLGGNGYIEDWPTARQYRDAQCHTIWEGTENIVSLDVLRAVQRDDAMSALLRRVDAALDGVSHPTLGTAADAVRRAREEALDAARAMAAATKDVALLNARRFTRLLADLAQGALLVEQAANEIESGNGRKAALATLFAQVRLLERPPLVSDGHIVLDLFEPIVRYGEVPVEAMRPAVV